METLKAENLCKICGKDDAETVALSGVSFSILESCVEGKFVSKL